MGQANSAQREPSMEEILASIRKIIEETDPPAAEEAPDQPAETASASHAVEALVPAAQTASPVSAELASPAAGTGAADQADNVEAATSSVRDETEVSAFREAIHETTDMPLEMIAADTEDAELESEPEPKPFSLADVQRRLVRERDSGAAAPAAESMAPPAETTAIPEPAAPAPDAEPAAPGALEEVKRSVEPVLAQIAELRAENSGRDTDFEAPAALAAGEKAMPEASEPAANRTAIISAEAGRQVAGAFDELKEAFMASRKRSFDEMAEEMMRPMLQDWLDNNLPLLVERLVREEIERIARGG